MLRADERAAIADDVEGAESLAELRDRLVAVTRERIDITGMCFLPFMDEAPLGTNGAFENDQFSTDHMREATLRMFPIIDRDIGGVSSLFKLPQRTIDLNAHFVPRGLEDMEMYNEYFRPHKAERQIVAMLGDDELQGVLVVSRSLRNRPFLSSDAQTLDVIRAATLRVLTRLLRDDHDPARVILGALAKGLPMASALFDARGAVLWASEAAASVLGIRSGMGRRPPGSSEEFRAWRFAALQAIASRSVPQEFDGLIVQRVELSKGVPAALVIRSRPRRSLDERARSAVKQYALTPREAELLLLLAEGRSNKEVASALGLSRRTVEVHVSSILRKAGAATRTELLARLFGRPEDRATT